MDKREETLEEGIMDRSVQIWGVRTFVTWRMNKKMHEQWLIPSVKHGWGVIVLGSFEGNKIADLFRVEGALRNESSAFTLVFDVWIFVLAELWIPVLISLFL